MLARLARGLEHAEGFALFVAVYGNLVQRERLLTRLAGLATRPLVRIHVPADSLDVLSAVEAHIGADLDARAALMVLDLDASAASTAGSRPALAQLNISRPAWRERLPHALVFWVPEYLAGLLGREAPDFLDWCSGFLDFADQDRDQEPQATPPPPTPKPSSAYETLDSTRRAERVVFLGDLLARDEPSSAAPAGASAKHEQAPAPRRAAHAHVIQAVERGRHLAYLGESQAALLALQKALELARRSGRRELEADVLTDVAGVLINLGRLEAAERALEDARVYAEALRRDDLRADVLANRATLALAQGDGSSAERHARDALALEQARPGRRPERLAGLHTSLAAALLAQRRDAAAEQALAQALELTQSLDPIASAPAAGSALINLGVIARRRGDLRQAERQFEAARVLAERSGHAATGAHAEANLGALCLDRGRHTEARAHLERARHAFGVLGLASEAQAAERALAALPPAAQDPR